MAMILIIEDSSVVTDPMKEFLENSGHEVHVREDGLSGLSFVMMEPSLDLVITDVMMPYMNGIELVRSIRKKFDITQLPIIMMSGYITVKESSKHLLEGVSIFMPKPISFDLLYENVKTCLVPWEPLKRKS